MIRSFRYYIFNLIAILLFVPSAIAQDSLNNNRDSSRHLLPDSLRRDLRGVNVKYLDNIHLGDIEKVIEAIAKKQEQYVVDLKQSKIKAPILQDVESQVSQLNSIKQSLANYKSSIESSTSAIHDIIKKHDVQESKFPRLASHLNTSLRSLEIKSDSITHATNKINALISKTANLVRSLEEDVVLDTVVEASSGPKTIWSSQSKNISKEVILNNIKNNYRSHTLTRYFHDIPWSSRILLLLLTLAYAYWCFKTVFDINRKKNIVYSTRVLIAKVVCKSVIFYLTLLPLVSLFTPTFIIQGAQVVIIILYLTLAFRKLTANQKKVLAAIILFYITVVFVNMIVSEDMLLRIICIAFNLIALAMVSYSKQKIRNKNSAGYINNFIYGVFAILNISAIVLNIIGKVDVSRSFSIASAVGLVQSFTLSFFTDMIREDLSLKFERDQIYKGFLIRFNKERSMKIMLELLRITCVILAILVLANNLQFIDTLVGFSEDVLGKKRKIGDINFTFSNLIVAVILLIITNWLQKNISLLVLGGEDGQLSQKYNQKMTLFPLVRLAIILVGFFFAVSALGMSLDKLTVVIGALSVGIGLGMQNIINNFVSGIILVFDKPFRVGDQIELADKKGRVKEIGIRASVLQTGDGADVIIPNGDLLSGRVVNWTLSHEYSKTSFTIMVDKQADLDKVKEWLKEAAESSSYFVKNLGVSISVQDISTDMVYLSVVAWVNVAANAGSFKSEVFLHLFKRFESENLKFYSIAPLHTIQ